MRRYRLIVSLIALAILVSGLSGCDNRTDFEKGVDKTAAKIKELAK
jgi:hypothetical protein